MKKHCRRLNEMDFSYLHPRTYLKEILKENPRCLDGFTLNGATQEQTLDWLINGDALFSRNQLLTDHLMKLLEERTGMKEYMWRALCENYTSVRAAQELRKARGTIIFLDIDGVLNTYTYSEEERNDPMYKAHGVWSELVARLNHLLAMLWPCGIVLSSTWRYMYGNISEVNGLLQELGIYSATYCHLPLCIGVTERRRNDSTRSDEIAQWLMKHFARYSHALAIDDESLDFSRYKLPFLHHVKVYAKKGLQKEGIERAWTWKEHLLYGAPSGLEKMQRTLNRKRSWR